MGLLQNLFAVLRGAPLLEQAASDFRLMTGRARDMVLTASAVHWSAESDGARSAELRDQDRELDELQSRIRRYVVQHLSSTEPSDAPYCLLLMSLVKDIERVGDYAKNLVRIPDLIGQAPSPLPEGAVTERLRELSQGVVELATGAPEIYESADVDRAREAVHLGKERARELDALLKDVAGAGYDGATATRMTLAIRFYKRIQGHFLKLLSSLLTPLDRLDQYHESGPEQM